MLRRSGVPALLIALAVPLGLTPVAAAAPASDVAPRAVAGRCPATALADRAVIRTEAGARLGTARMYVSQSGDQFVFCVRITPVERLRSRDTVAFLRHSTVDADGHQSPSMSIGLSWRHPFVLYGTFEPGSGVVAVATLRTPAGTKGTARVSGTVG